MHKTMCNIAISFFKSQINLEMHASESASSWGKGVSWRFTQRHEPTDQRFSIVSHGNWEGDEGNESFVDTEITVMLVDSKKNNKKNPHTWCTV